MASKTRHGDLSLNADRMQALLNLNQMAEASLAEITDFALENAVRLTQSTIGYLAFLNEDESVLTMHSWSKSAMAECAIVDKPIVYPVASTGLWGEAVRQRQPVITNDYAAANPLKKSYPQGHVAVTRHMNVPIFDGARIVAVAGVGNKVEEYDASDVQQLTLLMEGMWLLIARKRAQDELRAETANVDAIFESSPVAMMVLDETTNVVRVNAAAVILCGGSLQEVQNHRPGVALRCVHSAKDPRGCGFAPDCKICAARNGIEALLASGGSMNGAELPLDLIRDGEPSQVWMRMGAEPLLMNGRRHLCVALEDVTERKRAEEALRENELKFRALFETADDAILLFADGRWVDCNAGASRTFGCNREQILGAHPSRFSPPRQPDGRSSEEEAIKRITLAFTEGPQRFEWLHCRADGTPFAAEVCLNRLDLGGKPHIQAIVRDVSERKRSEAKFREASERLALATHAAKIGVWDWNVERDELVWDDGMYALYGIRREEFSGAYAAWASAIHPDDKARAEQAVHEALRGEREYALEFRIVWPDGSIHYLQAASTTFRSPDGNPTRMIGVNIDISERKASEELVKKQGNELMESQKIARLGNFSFSISTGMFATSAILDDIYGIDNTYDHSVAAWTAILHPDDRAATLDYLWNNVVYGQQPLDREFRIFRHNDNALRWVHARGRLDLDVNGRSITIQGNCQDITERKLAEEERSRMQAQMVQSQRLESVGTLASGVAHEINNPLNIVMNFAQLILDDVGASSTTHEFATHIVNESARMATIVRNLLTFSRHEKHEHSPVDVATLVTTTLSLVRASFRKEQIELIAEIEDGLPKIRCRSQQIQQVLMNLLTNARDALNARFPGVSPDKVIRVVASAIEREGTPRIRLTVEDKGGGLAPEVAGHVFEPFFTTKSKDKGTGLGLSISHRIVKEHRGELWFETEIGLGTKFHVDLKVDNGWSSSQRVATDTPNEV